MLSVLRAPPLGPECAGLLQELGTYNDAIGTFRSLRIDAAKRLKGAWCTWSPTRCTGSVFVYIITPRKVQQIAEFELNGYGPRWELSPRILRDAIRVIGSENFFFAASPSPGSRVENLSVILACEPRGPELCAPKAQRP